MWAVKALSLLKLFNALIDFCVANFVGRSKAEEMKLGTYDTGTKNTILFCKLRKMNILKLTPKIK